MTANIRTLLAQLELISHAPIQAYEFAPSDVGRGQRCRTSNRKPPIPHLGAHQPKNGDTKVPRGSDVEHRPRSPRIPRIDGDAHSEKAWDEFEVELTAWQGSYQRRTVTYFRGRLERAHNGQLADIARELEETIGAWRRMPMTPGQPPLSRADSQWKRYIGESTEDPGVLATRYSVTRRYINKIQQQYRDLVA